ncbi:MAG TPA: nuclear transport factor 2 family protein, partial [Solirubrobacterales bacterium]|nr:nuclear transport factor 2 family protein [Solirubrobacterales bacterium]
MGQRHTEIVEQVLSEWGKGNFRVIADHLDPHAVYLVSSDFPDSGVYVGLSEIQEYGAAFLAQWDRFTIQAQEIRAVGDTVVARVTQRGTGRVSGVTGDTPSFMLVTFRGSKIVRLDFVLDEDEALAALE